MLSAQHRGQAVTLALLLVVSAVAIGFPVGPAAAAGQTDVTYEDSSQSITAGETTTFTLVVTDASNGVGAFELSASIDPSVAEIQDASVVGASANQSISVADDGSSVSIEAFGLDTNDTGSVAIATVTVEGVSAGDTTLSTQIDALGDEAGDAYTLGTVSDASLSVSSNSEIVVQPQSESVTSGDSTTFDIVVTNVDNGVGAYDFEVTVDGAVANITDLTAQGNVNDAEIQLNGDTASVRAFGADTNDTGDVTIATVTVEGVAAGSTNVGLNIDAIGDEDGNAISVTPNEGELTVQTPASVSVVDVAASDTEPVVGDNVTVTATVENTGDVAGNITVDFTRNGQVFATQTVQVGGNSNATVTATTSFSQAGDATLGANGQTVNVSVQEGLEASVSFSDKTVQNGSTTVTVDSANVTSSGTPEDYVVVVHVVNDDGSISSPVGYSGNLSGQASNITVDLAPDASSGDVLDVLSGNVTLRAMLHETSANSPFGSPLQVGGSLVTDDANITVPEPTASVTFDNQTVTEGASEVTVSSAQYGNGDDGDFVVVVHQVASDGSIGAKIGESSILTSGTQTNITVDLQALDGGINNLTQSQELVAMLHTANTSSGNNANHGSPIVRDGAPVTDRAFITVEPAGQANLSVTDLQVSDATPAVNETIDLTAEVTNTGNASGSLTVEFTQNGTVIATETVQVAAGSTETVTVSSQSFSSAGNVTVGANGVTETVDVQAPANIQLVTLDVDSTVSYGETFNINATLENTGDLAGNETIEFQVDADGDGTLETIGTRTVSVAGGTSETVTLQFQFDTDNDNNGADPHVGSPFDSTALIGSSTSVTVSAGSNTQNASVSVTAPDAIGSSGSATDPDNDGIFEDVSGDGNFGLTDVFRLFNSLQEAKNTPGAFDLNGDGEVTVTDVQLLFFEEGS